MRQLVREGFASSSVISDPVDGPRLMVRRAFDTRRAIANAILSTVGGCGAGTTQRGWLNAERTEQSEWRC